MACYEGPVVDTHHHIWTDEKGWGPAVYWKPYGAAQYREDVAGTNTVASVYVECYSHYDLNQPQHLRSVSETAYAAALHAEEEGRDGALRIAAGIVANIDLLDDERRDEALDRHVEAGRGRLRGVRQSLAWDPDESLNPPQFGASAHGLLDPRMARGIEALRRHDLHFETYIYHPQIPDLGELAARFPDVPMVLNHLGVPLGVGRHQDHAAVDREWRAHIETVARQDNVLIKLGGLLMHMTTVDVRRQQAGIDRWTSAELAKAIAPYVDHALDCFGPERCLFESNFPMDRAYCSYSTLLDAYRAVLAPRGEAAARKIFHETPSALYRI